MFVCIREKFFVSVGKYLGNVKNLFTGIHSLKRTFVEIQNTSIYLSLNIKRESTLYLTEIGCCR